MDPRAPQNDMDEHLIGYCRGAPPSVNRNGDQMHIDFPPVRADFWCGLHRHKGWRRIFELR